MVSDQQILEVADTPGAVSVIMRLREAYGDEWLLKLIGCLRATKSRAANLWLIYKDECCGDISATKQMLDEWMIGSSESLGQWIIDRGLRCRRDAEL